MNRALNLIQARHNEDACAYLKNSGKFNDWVVTTAFYSAIHFIQHELFPKSYEIPGDGRVKNFHRFDDYYNCVRRYVDYTSPHQVRQDLVEEYIPEIADDYQLLKDNCWNARYCDYKVESETMNLCYAALINIRQICG